MMFGRFRMKKKAQRWGANRIGERKVIGCSRGQGTKQLLTSKQVHEKFIRTVTKADTRDNAGNRRMFSYSGIVVDACSNRCS